MQREAQCLVGNHDFSSYRAAACQASSPVREINHLSVRREGTLVLISVEANAFLMHMIRNIAGVLMAVGTASQAPGWAADVLEQRDRRAGGVTASPAGLYFIGVSYPGEFALPGIGAGPDLGCFHR